MRKLIFLLGFIVSVFTAKASHIQGGNITYHCLGGNTYQVTLTLFYDCGTYPISSSGYDQTLTVSNDCGLTNPTLTVNYDPANSNVEVSQLCGAAIPTSECSGGTNPGVWMAQWTGTITLPAACDSWTFAYGTCCWNTTNNGSGTPGQYYETTLNNVDGGCDDSPVITGQQIPYLCAGQVNTYSLGATDPDGNTLTYSLVPAHEGSGTDIAYVGGFSGASPIPGITIDPVTGLITVNPGVTGNYIIAVDIVATDAAGNVISVIHHQFQIVVVTCTNQTPQPPAGGLSGVTGGTQTGPNAINFCEGSSGCFNVVFTDSDAANILALTSNIAAAMPGATFSVAGTNPATATICWTPTAASPTSSTLTITAEDNACPIAGINSYNVDISVAPCTVTCLINNFTANVSAPTCGAVGGTYSVSGLVQTTNPPTSGTLTVSTSCGGSQIFNAPFAASIAYNLTGLTANGASCTITAVYSADPTCTQSMTYTAPTCPCNMDNLFVNIGACDGPTNTYEVDIDLEFSSPPATGTLNITVCGVTQTFTPPFVSPMTVNFAGLATGVGTCNVTATFSANPLCTIGLSYTAPTDCSCPADAGTFTTTMTGSGTTNYILCDGDQIDIVSNGDMTYPNDLSDPGTAYNPGIWILIYACPPTPGVDILADPCFLGVSPFTDDDGNMTDINDMLIINSFPPGTFTDNTVYYVPITMYDVTTGTYSLYPPPNLCFDLGNPVPVTYLPAITATGVENCAAQTVTVTVNGGHPEIFGTQFTASGLLPATASFVNTTCGDGGTIVISGLNNGDMYSFTITDNNGCPIVYSGGPFVGPVTPTLTPAGPFCTADPASNLTASIPGGTWTASCGACVTTGGLFTPATAGVGTHTVTYTPPGCALPATMTIDVQTLAITSVTTVDLTCFGSNDGSLTINSPGASQFSVDNGATFSASNVFNSLPAGTYNIEVQSAGGCSATTTATINEPTLLTVGVGTLQDETCFGACDGQVAALPAGGTSPYNVTWTGTSGGTGLSLSGVCSGSYTATVTDDNGCTATGTTTVTGAVAVTITSITPTSPTCHGGTNGSITIVASAGVTQYSINGGSTFQASGTFGSLPAGTYSIMVKDAAGCSATGTVTITEPSAVTLAVSPAVTICIGQSTTLNATGGGGTPGYTYQWNDPTNATTASITVNPTVTTTYTVNVTDNNGCSGGSASVVVTVNPPLAVNALMDQSICPGDNAAISALASGGNGGPYTYTWTNNINASTLTGSNQTVSPSVTTTYTVTVTDGCGTPSTTDAVIITLYPLPAVTYSIDNNQGCPPVVVNFTNTTSAGAGATCLWDFGDGSTSTNCNPTHVFTESGCYDISLNMTTSNGCAIDTVINNQVCVFNVPVADFTFDPNPTDIFNTEINFTNLTVGGNTYSWDFGGLGTSSQTNPQFTFPVETGNAYNVCLETENNEGCVDSTCHVVIINDVFLIYVPNAFTPGTDGINDVFLPILQGENPLTYELMIFNRWGEMIFQTNNKLVGWDGTHKGAKSKEDVYVWKIRVKKKQNEEKLEYIGHVTLLR